MIESSFPITHGFLYNEENDEFYKPHLKGSIIIWTLTIEHRQVWEISYVDEEDYQHFLGKGSIEDIERKLVIFTRDSKLEEILG